MIYLIRHGESMWNRFQVMEYDVCLTENGHQQARNVMLNVDLVVCSPMKRAFETLMSSKISYKKVIYNQRAREEQNGLISNYLSGENLYHEDFDKRMDMFKEELKLLSREYKTIAVVTHHGVIHKLTGIVANNCQVIVCPNIS